MLATNTVSTDTDTFTSQIHLSMDHALLIINYSICFQGAEWLGKIEREKNELSVPSYPTLIGFALWRWIIFASRTHVTYITRNKPAKKAAFGEYIVRRKVGLLGEVVRP